MTPGSPPASPRRRTGFLVDDSSDRSHLLDQRVELAGEILAPIEPAVGDQTERRSTSPIASDGLASSKFDASIRS
jgi:hypothetical protein